MSLAGQRASPEERGPFCTQGNPGDTPRASAPCTPPPHVVACFPLSGRDPPSGLVASGQCHWGWGQGGHALRPMCLACPLERRLKPR